MKYIGKGAFSKVFLNSDGATVTIYSSDKAKECLAMGWHDDPIGLFPTCSQLDYEVYSMEYFPRARSLKNNLEPEQYKLYKDLRELFSSVPYIRNIHDSYSKLYTLFDESSLDNKVKESLLSMLDSLINWGTDIGFEISPRNVAVKNGKLVLLDCFFFKSDLLKLSKSR